MAVSLRDMRPSEAGEFRRLNEWWIRKYFTVEEKDLKVFDEVDEYILKRGGRVFFACTEDTPIGCCALIPIADCEYELAKMGVDESAHGRGIGRALMNHAIHTAREMGARRLYIESNSMLTPAIKLYESSGFTHLPAERVPKTEYSRANVFMELHL
eukprot:TRINITY_DN14961_c0_g1_i1.p1 TRINITY_DN14961_c0_g1~~TRINITY_DN14961_c0_g1_i1.p1  ORF type:complete len:156 (+),score=21.34 TRINITY_DN14961_c0_g1_i1:42-509(+)